MGRHTDPRVVLEAFIKRAGSQRKAADALGIDHGYISRVRRGRKPFSNKLLEELGLRRAIVVAR